MWNVSPSWELGVQKVIQPMQVEVKMSSRFHISVQHWKVVEEVAEAIGCDFSGCGFLRIGAPKMYLNLFTKSHTGTGSCGASTPPQRRALEQGSWKVIRAPKLWQPFTDWSRIEAWWRGQVKRRTIKQVINDLAPQFNGALQGLEGVLEIMFCSNGVKGTQAGARRPPGHGWACCTLSLSNKVSIGISTKRHPGGHACRRTVVDHMRTQRTVAQAHEGGKPPGPPNPPASADLCLLPAGGTISVSSDGTLTALGSFLSAARKIWAQLLRTFCTFSIRDTLSVSSITISSGSVRSTVEGGTRPVPAARWFNRRISFLAAWSSVTCFFHQVLVHSLLGGVWLNLTFPAGNRLLEVHVPGFFVSDLRLLQLLELFRGLPNLICAAMQGCSNLVCAHSLGTFYSSSDVVWSLAQIRVLVPYRSHQLSFCLRLSGWGRRWCCGGRQGSLLSMIRTCPWGGARIRYPRARPWWRLAADGLEGLCIFPSFAFRLLCSPPRAVLACFAPRGGISAGCWSPSRGSSSLLS